MRNTVALTLLVLFLVGCGGGNPLFIRPTGTPTGTPTETPAATVSPTATITPMPTQLVVNTPIPQRLTLITSGNTDRIVQVGRVGDGIITDADVAWSPDSRYLAMGSTIGVYLFEVETMKKVGFYDANAAVTSLAFSPDGQTLAAGSQDAIRFWRVPDRSLQGTLDGHKGPVVSVTYSPDGALLASGALDGTVRVWDLSDGSFRQAITGAKGETSVTFSPDGSFLAIRSSDGFVRLWRVATEQFVYAKKVIDRLWTRTEEVFSPDGSLMVSGNLVWEVETGVIVHDFSDDYGDVTQQWNRTIAFSPSGEFLHTIAGGVGGYGESLSLYQWRVSDFKLRVRISKPDLGSSDSRPLEPSASSLLSDVFFVSLSPDSAKLVLGVPSGGSTKLMSFNTSELQGLAELDIAYLPYHRAFISKYILTSADGKIIFMDEPTGERIYNSPGGSWPCTECYFDPIAFTPNNSMIIGARLKYRGCDLVFYDIENESRYDFPSVDVLHGYGRHVALSPDGSLLAAVIEDEKSTYLDVYQVSGKLGRKLHTLSSWLFNYKSSTETTYFSLTISEDRNLLAVGSTTYRNGVDMWRLTDGVLVYSMNGHPFGTTSLSFSPDGTLIATGGYDTGGSGDRLSSIRIFSTSNGALVKTLAGRGSGKVFVDFSPDGSLLASGDHEGKIRIWQVSDWSLKKTIELYDNTTDLHFSSDGTMLVVEANGNVRLFGVP